MKKNVCFLFSYKIFLMILLLVCLYDVRSDDKCQINGNVEYLNTVPLIMLNIRDDIASSTLYVNYDIPDISSINAKGKKIGKKLNICPPIALIDVDVYESCISEDEMKVLH